MALTIGLCKPLIYISAHGSATDDEVCNVIDTVTNVSKSLGEKYFIYFCLGADFTLTGSQRREFSTWILARRKFDKTHAGGTVIEAPSTLVRGLVSAIFWIAPLGYPHFICEHRPQGLQWLLKTNPALEKAVAILAKNVDR